MRRLRRTTTLVTATLLALGLTAAPALAHQHYMVTPGTCVQLPTEPSVIHDGDPSGGQGIKDRGPGWEHALHPMHHVLHRGTVGDEKHGRVFVGTCP
jgi:hypothetical protein